MGFYVLGEKLENRKKPKDFDSIEAYIAHLQEDVKLDEKQWAKLSEADRRAYEALGSELKALEEECAKETLADVCKAASEREGEFDMKKEVAVYDSLKEALHKEFPDLSDTALKAKVANIKDFVQQAK